MKNPLFSLTARNRGWEGVPRLRVPPPPLGKLLSRILQKWNIFRIHVTSLWRAGPRFLGPSFWRPGSHAVRGKLEGKRSPAFLNSCFWWPIRFDIMCHSKSWSPWAKGFPLLSQLRTAHAHCCLHARASEPAVCAALYVLVVLLSVMYCRRRLLRALRAHACRGGNPSCACASGDTQYTRMPRACVRARVGQTLTSERCGVLSQPLMPRCDALRRHFDTPRPSLLRLWGRRTEPEALKASCKL